MSLIMDSVESGINKIEKGLQPNPEEILALSFYLGGENTLRITNTVKLKLMETYKINQYRNDKVLPSQDGNNYIVGETVPFNIIKQDGETVKGKAIINIELLILDGNDKIEGENPVEILMNQNQDRIITALRNNSSKIKKTPLEATNKEELLLGLNEMLVLDESEIIFYIDDMVILTYKVKDEIRLKVVTNIFSDKKVQILNTEIDIFDSLFV